MKKIEGDTVYGLARPVVTEVDIPTLSTIEKQLITSKRFEIEDRQYL